MKKGLSLEDSSLTNGTIAFTGKRTEGWLATLFCHAICSKDGGPSEAQSYSSADQESSGSTSLRFHSLEKISIQSFPKKIIYILENKLP